VLGNVWRGVRTATRGRSITTTSNNSPDGQNVTQVTQTQPGVHSVDLCSVSLPSGGQQLFVQTVGKPILANRMPAPVSYTPACSRGRSLVNGFEDARAT